MAYLSTAGSADFPLLKAKLQATDGNLSVQLRKLEEAGYVVIDKAFVGKKPPRLANRHRQQVRNSIVVGSLSACQDEAERASLTVCAGVDFRRKAAT